MKERLMDQFRKNLEGKTTEELTQIYAEQNEDQWSEEAFQIIRGILVERGQEIPMAHPSRKSKEEELSRMIKTFSKHKLRLPKVWIGYVLSALLFFFAVGAIPVIDSLAKTGKFPPVQTVPIAIPVFVAFLILYVAALLYWFFCVYKVHVILRNLRSSYPITPWRAVLYHFIPIFGFYWIFKWPKEVAVFVNSQWATLHQHIGEYAVARRRRSKYALGIVFLLTYFLDTAFTSIMPWQEGTIVSILFLFIVYIPLHPIISGVKEASVIDEWKTSASFIS